MCSYVFEVCPFFVYVFEHLNIFLRSTFVRYMFFVCLVGSKSFLTENFEFFLQTLKQRVKLKLKKWPTFEVYTHKDVYTDYCIHIWAKNLWSYINIRTLNTRYFFVHSRTIYVVFRTPIERTFCQILQPLPFLPPPLSPPL